MLTRFYLYRFLMYFYIWLPVSVIYMQEMRGISLTQYAAIGGVAWVVSALAEVPTGVVADVWGRRVSLAVGALLFGLTLVGKGLSSSVWALAAFTILNPVVFAFISGADMAWLYDHLKVSGREGEFVKHQGRSLTVMYASQGLAALLGSWLGTVRLDLPFLLYGGVGAAACVVALSLREPSTGTVRSKDRRALWTTFSQTIRLTRGNSTVRYSMLYSAVTYQAPFLLFYVFFQPIATSLGVPNGWIGAGLVALRAVSLAGSHWADPIQKRIGEAPLLWLTPLVMSAGMIGMALTPMALALPLLAGILFLNAVHRPVVSAVLNSEVNSEIRATVLSTVNLLSMLLLAPVEPMLGAVGDRWGIPAMLTVLGLTCAALAYGVLALWRPGKTAEPTPATA